MVLPAMEVWATAVYNAVVLENLSTEGLELVGNASKDLKAKVLPLFICNFLLVEVNWTLSSGLQLLLASVIPHAHRFLNGKKGQQKTI